MISNPLFFAASIGKELFPKLIPSDLFGFSMRSFAVVEPLRPVHETAVRHRTLRDPSFRGSPFSWPFTVHSHQNVTISFAVLWKWTAIAGSFPGVMSAPTTTRVGVPGRSAAAA